MAALILTGASGSGKTTIAKAIQQHDGNAMQVYFFDSVGVPSTEEMIAGWGSGDGWQKAITHHWLRQMALADSSTPVLLEGQMRIAFILEALQAHPVPGLRIVLVDCDDATRRRRLSENRQQPELANDDMMNWAAYLRREARAEAVSILDTSDQPLASSIATCRSLLFGDAHNRAGAS